MPYVLRIASPQAMATVIKTAPPLVVLDYRQSGQSLPPCSIRLPSGMAADLGQQADRLQTTRAGLARGLEDLKAA